MKKDLQKQVETEWKNKSNGRIVNVTIGEIRQLIENLTKHNNDFKVQACQFKGRCEYKGDKLHKEPSPKPVPCSECEGTGFWYCDERGNSYKKPVKCEDCNGTGFIKS